MRRIWATRVLALTARLSVLRSMPILIVAVMVIGVTLPATPAAAASPDTDGDTVTDDVDIDDDNDGIIDLNETTEAFTYASWSSFSGTTASGTIGGISFTYTADITIQTTAGMYDAASFPAQYNIGSISPAIRNDFVSTNTVTFSQPARNPMVVFSSIGNPGTPVSVQFDRPFEVLFSQGNAGGYITIDSTTRITGAEGLAILQFPGEHSSFSFDYLADEVYANFGFGADPRATVDSESDGKTDQLDLDSDNDGITDNVEAQTTAAYIAPSGVDSDGNGLDDAYESSPGAGEGLTPVDTDSDGTPDFRDANSDNNGADDIAERFDGQSSSVTSTADADGDGLLDIFEAGTTGDGFDANDANRDASTINLAGDHLLDADGANAVPLTLDSFFRDAITDLDADDDTIADVIELDPGRPDTDGTGGTDYLDTDADGDGIGDQIEYGRSTAGVVFSADSDGDGIPDAMDVDNTASADADADGVIDSFEPVDSDNDGTPDFRDLDSDADTVPDATETAVDSDSDGTPDYLDTDSDDDGTADGSDPNRAAPTAVDDAAVSYPSTTIVVDVVANDDFTAGANRSLSITGGTGPGVSSADASTGEVSYEATAGESGPQTVTYRVCNTVPSTPVCANATLTVTVLDPATDSDGDGVPDQDERGSDPNDPVDTDGDGTPDYLDTDADNDGTPDATDPNRLSAVAVDDTAISYPSATVVVDVVANDDLTAGAGRSLSITGGTAAGVAGADASTGEVTYQATAGESGAQTLTYRVCNTVSSSPVCADATLTVTVLDPAADSDDDGVPDSDERGSDPNDPVDTDGDGTPDYLDTDSDDDGTPDATDPNRLAATAVDDTAVSYPGVSIAVDVVANDDFTAGANRSLSITGGTAAGVASGSAATGKITYAPTAGESGAQTVTYRVCNTVPSTPVCADATVTITVLDPATDSDGDGIPDSDERGSDPNAPVDTDGDGTPDYLDTDADGDGIDDLDEGDGDTDGDGIPDHLDTDADNDGTPDASDPNRLSAVAADDTLEAVRGRAATVNLLANDDFSSGSDILISKIGGTALGPIEFDGTTGTMTFTPSDVEAGARTVVYQVCNAAVSPVVCGSATVTITVPAFPAPEPDPEPEPTGITITGQVYWDLNRNGRRDSGESDLSGVRVWLIGPGADGEVGTGDDEKLAPAVTASPYTFTNVAPGNYRIVVDTTTLPVGVYYTNDAEQSLTVTSEQADSAVADFGHNYAMLSGVFTGADGKPVPNATVTVTDSAGRKFVVTTDGDGRFVVEGSADAPLALGATSVTGTDASGQTVTRSVSVAGGTEPVSVTLTAAAASDTSTTDASPPAALANTGASSSDLAVNGLLLVLVGFAVRLAGRPRQRARSSDL